MLKLIGILVLSTQLNVAVEAPNGLVEHSFPNTKAGAEQLLDFVESSVGEPEEGIHIVVGWLRDEDDDQHIIEALQSNQIKHALSSPDDVRTAARENQLPEESAVAVVHAFKRRFAFLFREKPRK